MLQGVNEAVFPLHAAGPYELRQRRRDFPYQRPKQSLESVALHDPLVDLAVQPFSTAPRRAQQAGSILTQQEEVRWSLSWGRPAVEAVVSVQVEEEAEAQQRPMSESPQGSSCWETLSQRARCRVRAAQRTDILRDSEFCFRTHADAEEPLREPGNHIVGRDT